MFQPKKPARVQNGNTVYSFGRATIYMDRYATSVRQCLYQRVHPNSVSFLYPRFDFPSFQSELFPRDFMSRTWKSVKECRGVLGFCRALLFSQCLRLCFHRTGTSFSRNKGPTGYLRP